MKNTSFCTVIVMFLAFTLPAVAQEYGGLMIDYDLPGNDLRSMDISDRLSRNSNHVSELLRMNVQLAGMCRQRCNTESRCRAWTYEHTGNRPLGNDRFVWIGRCHLKSTVPVPVPKDEYGDYISGVKPAPPTSKPAPVDWKVNVDMPGNDYRSFRLKNASPEECLKACRQDSRCKAWTMVKPGQQGSQAVCWLKDAVPSQKRDNCCISGTRR